MGILPYTQHLIETYSNTDTSIGPFVGIWYDDKTKAETKSHTHTHTTPVFVPRYGVWGRSAASVTFRFGPGDRHSLALENLPTVPKGGF